MTRIIKYRAWHTAQKRMFDPKDIPVLLKNTKSDETWIYMQFLGSNAKNGQEIAEGDIVKWGYQFHGEIKNVASGFIHYNEHCSAWQVAYRTFGNEFVSEFVHKVKILEVVGDRYQNPELLKS